MTGFEAVNALRRARWSARFVDQLIGLLIDPKNGHGMTQEYVNATLGKILSELQTATESIEALSQDE